MFGIGIGLPLTPIAGMMSRAFGNRPTLDLNFMGGGFDSRITFTRADAVTCATYFDSTGRMQTAAANVARFDYDPASPAGVTGPELVTNGDFSNGLTGWVQANTGASTISVVNGVAVWSTNGTDAGRIRQSFTTVVGTRYKVSCSGTASVGSWAVGTTAGGQELVAYGVATTAVFVATSTTTWFNTAATTNGLTLDNVSVQEVTFAPRGLLIEESRQNLLLQSRDMTQAAWTKTDVTPARTQVGIDGVANTACLMTEGSATTAATVQSATVAAGSTITASIVLKRGNTDWVRLTAGGPSLTNGADAWFNLNTGAKGSVAARGTGTSNSSTITSLGGGWYRCAVTTLPDGAYTSATMQIASASADASTSRVANATYIVDCAQLEVGAFATSIIPTTTTALTRAADSASMTGTNFSSWFNASAGTFVVEATADTGAFSVTKHAFQLNNGGISSNQLGVSYIYQSAFVIADSPTSATKSAVAISANDYAICNGGGAVRTGTGAMVTWDRVYLGAAYNGNYANCHVRSLRYYPTRLANATLQALTA